MEAAADQSASPAPAPAPVPVAAPVAALDWVPGRTGYLGALGFLCAILWLNRWGSELPRALAAVAVLAMTIAPMVLYDVLVRRTYRDATTGLIWEPGALRPGDGRRVAVKLLGFAVTVGLLAFAYVIFSEYRKDNYQGAFVIMSRALLVLGPLAPIYFWWVDRHQSQPRDGFWQLGQLLLGRWREIDWSVLRGHALGWMVKGFYLPLMLGYLVNVIGGLQSGGPSRDTFVGFAVWSSTMVNALDLAFATVGYAMTFRVLNSHIRSAQPTALGWVSAVICYQPFWEVFDVYYLRYSQMRWHELIPVETGALHYLWGGAAILLEVGFVYCTVAFGLRFSNLTHRGIVRTGPYALTKHPAYIFKVASYAMISVPFATIDGSLIGGVKQCALLAILAGIYRIRAVTEERHLSSDPTYVAYAEEIRARHRRWATRLGLGRRFTRAT